MAAQAPSAPIHIPFESIAQTAAKTQHQDVTVAWALISPETAAEWFHVEAVQRGLEPLVLILHNGSAASYGFDPASVHPKPIPPDRAARRLSSSHPIVTAARYVKWLGWLPFSLVFVSIVEPSTGLEFPAMEEIIRRPMRSSPADLQAQLMKYELPTAPLGPDETRAGLLLIPPPALNERLSVTLVNQRTRELLVLSWNAQPAPVIHAYDADGETVWNATVSAATAIPSWSVISTDKAQGRVSVRRRPLMTSLRSSRTPPITITVAPVSSHQTKVALMDLPSGRHRLWFTPSTINSGAFFDDLAARITPKPPVVSELPPSQLKPSPSVSGTGSSVNTY